MKEDLVKQTLDLVRRVELNCDYCVPITDMKHLERKDVVRHCIYGGVCENKKMFEEFSYCGKHLETYKK